MEKKEDSEVDEHECAKRDFASQKFEELKELIIGLGAEIKGIKSVEVAKAKKKQVTESIQRPTISRTQSLRLTEVTEQRNVDKEECNARRKNRERESNSRAEEGRRNKSNICGYSVK